MRNGCLWALAAWLLAAGPLGAQIFPIPPAPRDYAEPTYPANASPIHAVIEPPQGSLGDASHVWTQFEYLRGWVREETLRLPLVTSGDPKNKVPGAIGQAGTTVLVGNEHLGYRSASGARLGFGGWVDPENCLGIEASGYLMEGRANNIPNVSDAAGNPLQATPFFNQTPGSIGESANILSNPGKVSGDILVGVSMHHWGTDMNGLFCLYRQPGIELSLLAGMRYDDLQEGLRILQHSLTLANNTNTTFDDHFDTRNQFYGAQLGGRLIWQRDVLILEMTGKIALGTLHQVVDIQGDSSQFGPKATPTGSATGGFFAQPSNIGRTSANPFAALPSMQAKLGYQITPCLRAFLGYDMMYLNEVVRPANQIDRNINLTQSAILGATKGVLKGAALPAPHFQRTSFWAQDVSFGFELRF